MPSEGLRPLLGRPGVFTYFCIPEYCEEILKLPVPKLYPYQFSKNLWEWTWTPAVPKILTCFRYAVKAEKQCNRQCEETEKLVAGESRSQISSVFPVMGKCSCTFLL